MSGPLLAEDGARFTIIKRTEDGPQACYRLVFDAGERSMVEATYGCSRRTPRRSNGLRWKLIDAASPGGNAFRSEQLNLHGSSHRVASRISSLVVPREERSFCSATSQLTIFWD